MAESSPCKRHHVVIDGALHESTASTMTTTQLQRKKSHQPSSPSKFITKLRHVGDEGDPNVWGNLGDDMINRILSFLPVYKLHDTVTALGATRWALVQTILAAASKIRDDSAISGFIRAYSSAGILAPNINDPEYLSALRVLEYDTNSWHAMPKWPACPPSNAGSRVDILDVCDGLLCLGDLTPSNVFEIGVWNPLTNSHRWICRSPFQTCSGTPAELKPFRWAALVVDRDHEGYKIVALVSKQVQFRAQRCYFLGHVTSSYAVYDSSSGSWNAIRPAPRKDFQLTQSRVSVSCEGRVIFVLGRYEAKDQYDSWEWPGLVCYNPSSDSWVEVMFSPGFLQDLVLCASAGHDQLYPRDGLATRMSDLSCDVYSLLYSAGKVYVVFRSMPVRTTVARGPVIHVVSIDMVNVVSGIASFDLVTRVWFEVDYCDGTAHPEPCARDEGRRSELTVARGCATKICLKSWYICKIGGRRYLCALVCGKWLEMFDLAAQKWDARRAMQVAADTIIPKIWGFSSQDWAYTPSGISP